MKVEVEKLPPSYDVNMDKKLIWLKPIVKLKRLSLRLRVSKTGVGESTDILVEKKLFPRNYNWKEDTKLNKLKPQIRLRKINTKDRELLAFNEINNVKRNIWEFRRLEANNNNHWKDSSSRKKLSFNNVRLHANPTTVRQRLDNAKMYEKFNENHADDIFENVRGKMFPARLLDDSCSSVDSVGAEVSVSPRSPVVPPLPRVLTPDHTLLASEDTAISPPEKNSFHHLTFVNRVIKERKREVRRRKSVLASSEGGKLQIKSGQHLKKSVKKVESYDIMKTIVRENVEVNNGDDSSEVEEYFSEFE